MKSFHFVSIVIPSIRANDFCKKPDTCWLYHIPVCWITFFVYAKETIKKLKEIGIGFIALDDFGTGYSSISNLINFPIDIVKIDNFFINRLNDKKYCKITASLIALIKKFNILSIAEGVETKQQFELLRGMGCDYFQGFYFSKPQSKLYPLLV